MYVLRMVVPYKYSKETLKYENNKRIKISGLPWPNFQFAIAKFPVSDNQITA